MPEYGSDDTYIVYEVVQTHKVRAFEQAYGLLKVTELPDYAQAVEWIKQQGTRHTDYTILPNFRLK